MPFLGQIVMFTGIAPPLGCAPCDGASMSVQENEDLFSAIGYDYGGGGPVFNLPDMRSRVPIHVSVTDVAVGQLRGGQENVTLLPENLPAHSHLAGANANSSVSSISGNELGGSGVSKNAYATDPVGNVSLDSVALATTGSGLPHSNIQPYTTINFCICVFGGTVPTP